MTGEYLAPVPLSADHRRDAFECNSYEQTRWLRDYALTSQQAGLTRVNVVTERGSPAVVAYYAWTMGSVAVADAPVRLTRGAGRYPQPVALLARLGVDSTHERLGLGSELLRDVMVRTVAISQEIGCRALVVHCENEAARSWYLRRLPAFEQSPTDSMHLVLLTKDIRAALGG